MNVAPTLHCPCNGAHEVTAFTYDAPPKGETAFDFGQQAYARRYQRCFACGHWRADHAMQLGSLYGGAYVSATYGDRMRTTFERIIGLPADRSDNTGRVERVLTFGRRWFPESTVPRLLDVGSGLAVFPYRMRQAGWDCTALDPDESAATHAREVAGVAAVTGDFATASGAGLGRFDVVTLNKVLEHVEDPVALLSLVRRHLEPRGFVYVEVPDEAAAIEGPEREEFFIEHLHVFSPASLAMLADRSGLTVVAIERLREPSSKFTLRAFLCEGGRS